MIIVSQDKTKIVNFDNLTQIYITQDEEETATFIRYETVDSLYDDLGEYKTEERAKEVLEEIEKAYSSIQILPFLHISVLEGFKGKDLAELTAYKMPEE